MKLTLGWFYPKLMNLYGDRGNIIALAYRCRKRNIELEIENINIGNKIDLNKFDLLFFGGGQDKEQIMVAEDLKKYQNDLRNFYNQNRPMLAICGGYQLMGAYFLTSEGRKIHGLGILDFFTRACEKRMIGNIAIKCSFLDNDILVGFENHSGKTFLTNNQESLGQVIKGFGNNGVDKNEGIKSKNFIGTYLHGPILPKNPELADWFIQTALEIKYNKKIKLEAIDDNLEQKAKNYIYKKYIKQ